MTKFNLSMRRVVLPAMALASAFMLADCVSRYDRYGYDLSDYARYPSYDGSVYIGGTLRNGPFHYRDYGGHRQYWYGGGWQDGDDRHDNDRGHDRDRDHDRDHDGYGR